MTDHLSQIETLARRAAHAGMSRTDVDNAVAQILQQS